MFFDDSFERHDALKKKEEKEKTPTLDKQEGNAMHIDIIPFGETSAEVCTKSVAHNHHEQMISNSSHPHINEVIKKADDLELVPLHGSEGSTSTGKGDVTRGRLSQNSGDIQNMRSRIELAKKRSESDLIMKHDYVPFRGRKN